MRILERGHLYEMQQLDSDETQTLCFVKRVGPNFPGNVEPPWGGVTTQEVLRCLIDRTIYMNMQHPHSRNRQALGHMRDALVRLEERAAAIMSEESALDRVLLRADLDRVPVELLPTCDVCGHIACLRHAIKP